jgi:hypothetical protein
LRTLAPAVCSFQGLPFLRGARDDRCGPARRDGGVAGAGVVGAVGCDHADGLIARDLVQQVGQHGRIADPTARDLDGPDFQCFRVVVGKTVHWTVF